MFFFVQENQKNKVGVYQQIPLRFFKKYSIDEYEEALGQVI